MNAQRDGFEIVEFESGEVTHFVACEKGGSQRDRVEMGLLRNMDRERFFPRDTRAERDLSTRGTG